ncbi:MAG: hypothetical protein OHK0037_16820 [Elainellaceae cyanobacterium]
MPYSATLRRVFLCAALPLAIALPGTPSSAIREAFAQAVRRTFSAGIAQAQQTPSEPLQPAVPFPTGGEEVTEPAITVPTAEPPAVDEPLTEDPVAEDPVTEAPAAEDPIVEIQPATPAPPPATASPAPQFPSSTLRRSPSPFSSGPLFESLTLTPNADPSPKTIRGISGGPIPASDVAGRPETATGPCLGFVDTQPDHILTLTQAFDFLSLQVQSAEDTTLVVKGPGGSWCNDNYLSLNPGIAGQWLPGRYEIWIGSHRNNGYFPYVIRVLQQMEAGE